MRTWIPLLAVLVVKVAHAAEPDHLDFEGGPFGAMEAQVYEVEAARLLLPDKWRVAEMVSLPSFTSESAVYIARDHELVRVVSNRFKGQLWYAINEQIPKDPRGSYNLRPETLATAARKAKVEVETASAPISVAAADRLERAWRVAIAGAAPRAERGGRDGTTYVFAQFEGLSGYRAARTWSPSQGTRCLALVELAEHLAAYAQLPEGKRAEAEKALVAEADAVAARFAASETSATK